MPELELKTQSQLQVINGMGMAGETYREHEIRPQLLSERKGGCLATAADALQDNARLREMEARTPQLDRMAGR